MNEIHRVFIGIGSNSGDRRTHCHTARRRIQKIPGTRVVKESSVYESEPHGNASTWFANSVVEIETELPAQKLLEHLQKIESSMGRKRTPGEEWESRTIDLDILFFGTERIEEENLKVPHPEIPNRRFVLLPLSELAPQLIHPTLSVSISNLLITTPDTKRIHLMGF